MTWTEEQKDELERENDMRRWLMGFELEELLLVAEEIEKGGYGE